MLSKRISQISKFLLLCNLLIGGLHARVVSSDRFILKIIDRTVSVQDLQYQLRNLEALDCIYDDSFVIQFFEKSFLPELKQFLAKLPEQDEEVRRYLHANEEILQKCRYFFKMLRYSEDQKTVVTEGLTKAIRQSARENKCRSDVLYKDTLKTNFIDLMSMELYLRARYSGQLKNGQLFNSIRSSLDLFVESLDKQFNHEYFW